MGISAAVVLLMIPAGLRVQSNELLTSLTNSNVNVFLHCARVPNKPCPHHRIFSHERIARHNILSIHQCNACTRVRETGPK